MKADELWNNWFTVNHVNYVKSILAEDFNGPTRGRKWMKLRRDDARSKSVNTKDSFKARDTRLLNGRYKMGQLHSKKYAQK